MKKNCCGCEACSQRCPKHCIEMIRDREGFLYPKIDQTACIACGLCEEVCPVIHQGSPRKPIKSYAAVHPDRTTLLSSSSGGAFSALAEIVLANHGVVFGAKFTNDWTVAHDYTETLEGLAAFRGSKYLQSRIGKSYVEVERFLKEGRQVLFTGTPCQVAGLKRYLRKDYGALLVTVDLICHGVPSPMVWKDYLNNYLRPKGAADGKNTDFQHIMPPLKAAKIRIFSTYMNIMNRWRKIYMFVATCGISIFVPRVMIVPPVVPSPVVT